ncbi:MAG: ATP synthase subunit I [Eubacteriaceae bacterium]
MIQIGNNNLDNNTLIKRSIYICGIISIGSVFFVGNYMDFILGLIFGEVFSVLNFRLLHLTIQKSLKMSASKAQSYVTIRYLLRYVLMGIVIYVSINNPSINVLGTITGLLLLKFVIIVSNALYKSNKINKQ